MKGLSLFSGAGIGEYYLDKAGIDIICANELIKKRAALYQATYPKCKMICGDINDEDVFNDILSSSKGIDFLLASPPCQGMSVANKFKKGEKDTRNLLVLRAIKAIELLSPTFVIIENVPALLKIKLPWKEGFFGVLDILDELFGKTYEISAKIADAADFGVPQKRLRAIIRLWKKGNEWDWPDPVKRKKTVRDAIGDLPSLEAGQISKIKWHFARKHSPEQILVMQHTPTGHSAFENPVYYPKKPNGERVHGFNTTYRRMEWDKPCPTITMRNDAISSQRNVHPGRLLPNGTYSDARVLTPLELMLCDSLPADWRIPDSTPEILIRQVIGESIPPLMIEKIAKGIKAK